MKVVILAAGYATRLEPLTLTTPKSLLPVAGRPIIDRILDKVAAIKDGAASTCIITNAKFFENFKTWLKASKRHRHISLINDGTTSNERRLGAIRDLEIVIKSEAIDDDLLVIAGDNLFGFDLNEFLKFAKNRSDGVSIALYDIKDLDSRHGEGHFQQ